MCSLRRGVAGPGGRWTVLSALLEEFRTTLRATSSELDRPPGPAVIARLRRRRPRRPGRCWSGLSLAAGATSRLRMLAVFGTKPTAASRKCTNPASAPQRIGPSL